MRPGSIAAFLVVTSIATVVLTLIRIFNAY